MCQYVIKSTTLFTFLVLQFMVLLVIFLYFNYHNISLQLLFLLIALSCSLVFVFHFVFFFNLLSIAFSFDSRIHRKKNHFYSSVLYYGIKTRMELGKTSRSSNPFCQKLYYIYKVNYYFFIYNKYQTLLATYIFTSLYFKSL